MAKYRRSFAEDDEMLQNVEDNKAELNEPATSPEDEVWKKRYSDLRSHQAKEEKKLQAQIDELKDALKKASETDVRLPATTEQLEDFMKTYPKMGAVVQTMIETRVREMSNESNSKLSRIDELEQQLARDKAKMELEKLQPDFFTTIVKDPDFHEWLDACKNNGEVWKWEAIMENDSDARLASDVIDMYKNQKPKNSPKERKDTGAAAATNMRGSTAPKESDGKKYLFKESEIGRMSATEYERKSDEIMEAHQKGLILMDVSGAAR